MWLLDVKTRKLVKFLDGRKAAFSYAILSHTWDEEEVSFADIHRAAALAMKGCRKIDFVCKQAERDRLSYAWVDTCWWIDKDGSAERSEAINAMFRWYQNSAVCYVYLGDVDILTIWESCYLVRRPLVREAQKQLLIGGLCAAVAG